MDLKVSNGKLKVKSKPRVFQDYSYSFDKCPGLVAALTVTSDEKLSNISLKYDGKSVGYCPPGVDLTDCGFSSDEVYSLSRGILEKFKTISDLDNFEEFDSLVVLEGESVIRKFSGEIIPLKIRLDYISSYTSKIRFDKESAKKFESFLLTEKILNVVAIEDVEVKPIPHYNQNEDLGYRQYDVRFYVKLSPELYEGLLKSTSYFQPSKAMCYLAEQFLAKYPECSVVG